MEIHISGVTLHGGCVWWANICMMHGFMSESCQVARFIVPSGRTWHSYHSLYKVTSKGALQGRDLLSAVYESTFCTSILPATLLNQHFCWNSIKKIQSKNVTFIGNLGFDRSILINSKDNVSTPRNRDILAPCHGGALILCWTKPEVVHWRETCRQCCRQNWSTKCIFIDCRQICFDHYSDGHYMSASALWFNLYWPSVA